MATFITNLIGALVIGFIVGLAEEKDISEKLVLFIKTGFYYGLGASNCPLFKYISINI